MGREYKNNAISKDHFIEFLRKSNNFTVNGLNNKIIKDPGKVIKNNSVSLSEALPLLEDRKNEEDLDISEKLSKSWLNAHLEEKKNLSSAINNKTKKKSELGRVKLAIFNLRRTGQNIKHTGFFNGIKAQSIIYVLLAILIFSSILAFQKKPSSALVGFFDAILLSPIKALSSNNDYYYASINERSNYIKLNHQELTSRYAKGEAGINIDPDDLKGSVAGVYEDNSLKEKKGISEAIDKMIQKQKNLSLLLGEKISEWINK
jgi:hypothetical protein